MEFEDLLIIIGIVAIGLLVVFLIRQNNSNDDEIPVQNNKVTYRSDLISDDKVTVSLVEQKLKIFNIQIVPGRKNGFTEKDIHKQLEIFLKEIFQNVTMDHGVESKNAKAIDVDIANGKVGIEVKLASEIFKEGGWDRAIGQMVKYTRLKYKNENLIFLIAGFNEDLRNSMLSDFEDDVHSHNCKFLFKSAGDKQA